MNKSEMFWQTYLNLENELIEISKHIFFTDEIIVQEKSGVVHQSCNNQLETFSPNIADLLIRTSVEIEAISKELYFELGGQKNRGDISIKYDEDCLKVIDEKCKTHKKVVLVVGPMFNFTKEQNKILKPLKNAHKRQGCDWARAYQAVKHDRYSSLHRATVKVLIRAMAALYLLNIYNRDIKLSSKYFEYRKLDFSFGSKIFALKLPNENYVIDVVNGKSFNSNLESEDSPYILKYTDKVYKEILEANITSVEERKKHILSQPELNNVEFMNIFKSLQQKNNNVRILSEIHKYRLNKKIPHNLSFEERKQVFIKTPEWNGRLRQNNNPLKEWELNENNIQEEIDRAGNLAGLEIDNFFENIKFAKAFNDGYCELVLDKGNVIYKND